MQAKMLDKKYHIDKETGFLLRYVRSDTEYFRPHFHNYYELFLVLKGDVCHIINSKEQPLSEGNLLFIRDFDIHDYKSADGNYFEFMNLAFTKEMFSSMLNYLGTGFGGEKLLSTPFPPAVTLSPAKKEKLFFQLAELNENNDKELAKTKAKILILNIFTEYFSDYSEEEDDIPLWLEVTCEKIKKPQNFIAGTKKLYEISGKSREHLSRCLKKWYNTSPSAMITDLRLEYSSKFLLTSNLPVTDICYECGFENLSWFYKQFCKKYNMTPAEYRRRYEFNFK